MIKYLKYANYPGGFMVGWGIGQGSAAFIFLGAVLIVVAVASIVKEHRDDDSVSS